MSQAVCLQQHLISVTDHVRKALQRLDVLASDAILFAIDDEGKLVGSLTDGDIRRGLIKGQGVEDSILDFLQPHPKYLVRGQYDMDQLVAWRSQNFKIIPVVDADRRVVDIVNFRLQRSYLPIDAVIMAGGKGTRLRPMTLDTPKPLLRVGGKPIVEYNVDRLKAFGIRNITLSIKYLGQQLVDYFGDGSDRDLVIRYVSENSPLGTIGAVGLVQHFDNDYILVMNSDLLTNINYEDLFIDLLRHDADMVVATTPYDVQVPYGIIETDGDQIIDLREKPTYTYYANAGIYIVKREHISLIPAGEKYNATDLMSALCTSGKKVVHHPILDYWLDIGKPHDYKKAQEDIKQIKF